MEWTTKCVFKRGSNSYSFIYRRKRRRETPSIKKGINIIMPKGKVPKERETSKKYPTSTSGKIAVAAEGMSFPEILVKLGGEPKDPGRKIKEIRRDIKGEEEAGKLEKESKKTNQ